MRRLRQAATIVALCIGAAVGYGIVHDQVTARVCLEYFTVGHGWETDLTSPTLIGLRWGVLATWWVGLLLGLPLAAACQAGPLPPVAPRDLLRPLGRLLLVLAVLAVAAGVAGYISARLGWVWLLPPVAERVASERHARFLAALWSHTASYTGGFLGGNVLLGWAWRQRRLRQMARKAAPMPGRGGVGAA